MSINRESIYGGLFTLLATQLMKGTQVQQDGSLAGDSTGLCRTLTRRLKHFADVGKEQQPCVFMYQRAEHVVPDLPGVQTAWTLDVMLYVYVLHPGAAAGPVLNPILDAIEQCFNPDNADTGSCTLGGLVTHATIEGDILIYEGDLDDQEIATVPVRMLVRDSGGGS